MKIILAEHKYRSIEIELFNPKGEEEAEGWVSHIVNEYDRQKNGTYLLTDRKARAVLNWCYEWVYCTAHEDDRKTLHEHGWRLGIKNITIHISPSNEVTFFLGTDDTKIEDFRIRR